MPNLLPKSRHLSIPAACLSNINSGKAGKLFPGTEGLLFPVGDIAIKDPLTLPVRNADQLLRYDTGTGLLDTSYAAAWELGRLLTLQDKKLSLSIFEWKTLHAHELKQAEEVLVFSHLPFTDPKFEQNPGSNRFKLVTNYFRDLELLKRVPFQYLVPDSKLLPVESIRFFQVDPKWVECLMDGAFSIGRVTGFDEKLDTRYKHYPAAAKHPVMSGLLIRSDVVSGWPDLKVEGYGKWVVTRDFIPARHLLFSLEDPKRSLWKSIQKFQTKEIKEAFSHHNQILSDDLSLSKTHPNEFLLMDNPGHRYFGIRQTETGTSLEVYAENKLPLLRVERLSPNVLLVLFKGVAQTVDISLPGEALHFGYVRPFGEDPDYYKELKDLSSGKEFPENEGKSSPVVWRDKNLRVVNVHKQQQDIKGRITPKTYTPAEFAVEMIEGVPKIRFTHQGKPPEKK